MRKKKCWGCRFFNGKNFCRLLGQPLENINDMNSLSKKCDVKNVHERDYHKRLNKIVKSFARGNKMLVLGCHPDSEIDSLIKLRKKSTNSLPINFTVIEPDKRFAKFFRERPHTKVIQTAWEDFKINDFFDCILCLDCIEHSKKPYKILNKIVNLSNYIILSCPNGLYYFQDPHKYQDHGHGPHISHFSRSELKEFFKLKGFKVKVRGIRNSWLGPFSFGIFLVAER